MINTDNIAPELINNFEYLIERDKRVTIHFEAQSELESAAFRIWPTTFLIDKNNQMMSKLIGIFNVKTFPEWTLLPKGKKHTFTLVFEGLDSSCEEFDIKEVIPQEGEMHIKGIKRNKTDIYRLKYGL